MLYRFTLSLRSIQVLFELLPDIVACTYAANGKDKSEKYAVSTRDNLSFHQQLNAALAWLENNEEFINKDSLIKEIKALEKNDLLPKLPDISEPSILLAKYAADSKEQK